MSRLWGAQGCHVPELNGRTLVLSLDVIAAIYLNQVTVWNDARIKATNSPEVAAALPLQAIVVITEADNASDMAVLVTGVLSSAVPEFNITAPSID
jgi:ABC-type phosphate transport system substrate-binding protein